MSSCTLTRRGSRAALEFARRHCPCMSHGPFPTVLSWRSSRAPSRMQTGFDPPGVRVKSPSGKTTHGPPVTDVRREAQVFTCVGLLVDVGTGQDPPRFRHRALHVMNAGPRSWIIWMPPSSSGPATGMPRGRSQYPLDCLEFPDISGCAGLDRRSPWLNPTPLPPR